MVVRQLIYEKKFSKALKVLQTAVSKDPVNADIYNLLGFTSRNLDKNKIAGRYYAKALQLNPEHLGALEYQGELFIKLKNMNKAKENLARLKALCGVNCEEYLDLRADIEKATRKK